MTVAEELLNRRNCRYRLAGVLIAVDGRGVPVPVAHTYWGKDSKLGGILEGIGGEFANPGGSGKVATSLLAAS
jgi:hypothetical protein